MSIVGAIITFTVSWWLFLFMALPFGVRPQEDPIPGTDPGAPQNPRLLIKFLVVTIIAGLFTYGASVLIESGLIDLDPQTPRSDG